MYFTKKNALCVHGVRLCAGGYARGNCAPCAPRFFALCALCAGGQNSTFRTAQAAQPLCAFYFVAFFFRKIQYIYIYMVESVNLPCILGTLRAESPGVSKLVRILGCTADFGYLKGTLRVI